MTRFVSLTVQGFRSFRKPARLEFGDAGLVQVLGINECEPELDSNGAGKSTVFEALQWVLFGRTSRNLRAGDVANWNGVKRCEVTLELEKESHKYILRRAWNPNELELSTDGDVRPVDQETLEQELGFTPETFLYSVFHAQFTDNFATLTPARQLEIYTAALRLDLWEALSEQAADLAKPLRLKIGEHEKELARIKGGLAADRATLEMEQDKETAWYRARWLELLELRAELYGLLDDQETLKIEHKKLVKTTVDTTHAKQLEKDYLACEARHYDLRLQIGTREATVKQIEAAANKLKEKPTCPTCGQDVDSRLVKHRLQEAAPIRAEIANLKADHDSLLQKQATIKKELKLEEDRIQAANRAYIGRESTLRNQLDNLRCLVGRNSHERVKIARRDCPHDSEAIEELITEHTVQMETKSAELENLRHQVAGLEYWIKGFRDIRLALIQTSLAQFEIVANNAAHALGLTEWSLEFGVESETKSGKLHRGFTVHIRSPYNSDRVPFTAWSGGESQRLALAIGIGFADLVRDFSGIRSSVEIFDEPGAWVSGDMGALLDVLHERAHDNATAIFLIDHRTLESGSFDRSLTITKDQHGSRINP